MEPITPAEHALLVAAEAGKRCDLRTPEEGAAAAWVPSADEASRLTEDRAVRAAFLSHLVTDLTLPVHLTGARIDGDFTLAEEQAITLSLQRCVLTGRVMFRGATFSREARFGGTLFNKNASFAGAAFIENASFDGATFIENAVFDGATFVRNANFEEARFTLDAWFGGATFNRAANFGRATFSRAARFPRTLFTEDAGFYGTTFTENAWFDEATFAGKASFNSVRFKGAVSFGGVAFTGDVSFEASSSLGTARFTGAEFFGLTQFRRSGWPKLDWSMTMWKTSSVVTTELVAHTVDLNRAVFAQPVRLELTAAHITMQRTRGTERVHLVVAGAKVNLEDADLAEGSLIEAATVTVPSSDGKGSVPGGGSWVPIPPLLNEYGGIDVPNGMLLEQWLGHVVARINLDRDLSNALSHAPRTSVASLQRAHITGTTLSGMDLRACTFTGADGLDELVITGEDILTNNQGYRDESRAWPAYGRKWWRTNRRVLHDELELSNPPAASTSDAAPADNPGQAATSPAPLTYRSVSATYRSLRKALEDSKDEPGAADFYYGEMEMRRLASKPISVERWLLALYRLVSGYGLRAWRAIASLAVVVGVASACFIRGDNPVIPWEWVRTASPEPTPVIDPDSAVWPLAFAAQETIALFRPTGARGVTLVGFGVVVDIVVRILGPVLLALAVLAIRNRTKR